MDYLNIESKYDNNVKYLNVLLKQKQAFLQEKDLTKKVEMLKDAYQYVKDVSPYFYEEENQNMAFCFNYLINILAQFNDGFPKVYITSNNPTFKFTSNDKIFKSLNDEDILTALVNSTRSMLYKRNNRLNKKPLEFAQMDLTGLCGKASSYITKLCKKWQIPNQSFKIEPGFQRHSLLYNGYGYHYFNIVTLNKNKYLVDCTYSQFFLLVNNLLEKNGIANFCGCCPGIYMTMTKERLQTARKILTDGWIKLDGPTLKNYLDGFTISYRNGIYYEETNNFSYTTNYTSEDYRNFLNGTDTMLNYEPKKHLGFQHKPLKNPNLNFQKR